MVSDRSKEVHGRGSRRTQGEKSVPASGGSYKDASGELQVFGPPGTPPAEVAQSSYSFTIDGNERGAVEACTEYFGLTERLVEQFKTDHR